MHTVLGRGHRPQRGIALLDALIAFLVLCLAMLAVARLQPAARQQSDVARQRSEAVRLAQQEIERLRGFTSPAVGSGATYADIVSGAQAIDSDSGTRYQLERVVEEDGTAHAKRVTVAVAWAGRDGNLQRLALDTLVAAADPAMAGAFSLAPRAVVVRGAQQRAAQVPLGAKDLGDGRSVFKPVSSEAQAWLFDNLGGTVTARCTVDAARPTSALTPADLGHCAQLSGLLLSGEVHFASSAPLPLGVNVRLDGPAPAMAPWCRTEALKTVAITTAAGLRIDAVPVQATPASMGLAEWQERGETFAAYHCVIVPAPGLLRWSGRIALVPEGWNLGSGANDWHACRVTPDLDGSGAIDSNLEHPPIYENVSVALTRQNFRMVRGDQPCPAGTAGDPMPST